MHPNGMIISNPDVPSHSSKGLSPTPTLSHYDKNASELGNFGVFECEYLKYFA
jgi:hypothetical protein